MKKKLLLSIVIAFITVTIFGQGFTRPSEGKAVVYVVNIMLGLSKTQIHHNTECIGVLKSKDYIRYECDPGNHLFIGIEAANKVFFTADLEANNIYVVQMRRAEKALGGQAPTFKAIDINKSNKKEKILKIVNNNPPISSDTDLVKKINTKWKKFTEKAIAKFETKLRKKNKHMHISADMTYKK